MLNNNNKAEKLLTNLTFNFTEKSIYSIKEGVKKLRGKQKDLEVIHIFIDPLSPKTYPPKKKYFNITRVDTLTKLDEWISDHLIDENEYRKYLEKYSALKEKLNYENVDEYIFKKYYRPEAIKILSKRIKNFNLKKWIRKRFRYEYRRKSNLWLKDGTPLRLDFRNILQSIFILKKNDDKQILAIGGSGSSGQRGKYTLFTTIFYLFGKERKIAHHFLRYNSFNQYKYISTYYKPIVTVDLGSNYFLDEKIKEEITKNSLKLKLKKNFDFELE